MSEIIQFQKKQDRYYIEMEAMLDESLLRFPSDVRKDIKKDILTLVKKYNNIKKFPSDIPGPMTEGQVTAMKDAFEVRFNAIRELSYDLVSAKMELELMKHRSS